MSLIAVNLAAFNLSDEDFDRHLSLLDDTSQARIRRFKRREDALRCLIGRLLPLYLLSRLQVDHNGSPVTFQINSHGRPSFASPILDPPLDYNVSHDGDWVVMGWTRGPSAAVGVDVMRLALPKGIRNANELVEALQDQLSSAERRALASTPLADRTVHLLRLWMHKEAIAKLLGTGSAEDFATLSFELPAFDPSTPSGQLVRQPSGVLSVGVTEDGRTPDDVTFWEGRLDGYGLVLVKKCGKEDLVGVTTVKVGEVLEGAVRLGSYEKT